jgi:hypothetical protein
VVTKYLYAQEFGGGGAGGVFKIVCVGGEFESFFSLWLGEASFVDVVVNQRVL